jgi:hypothetical protein
MMASLRHGHVVELEHLGGSHEVVGPVLQRDARPTREALHGGDAAFSSMWSRCMIMPWARAITWRDRKAPARRRSVLPSVSLRAALPRMAEVSSANIDASDWSIGVKASAVRE